jgi:hypothetical protein
MPTTPESAILTLPRGFTLEDGTEYVLAPSAAATQPYGGATMNWALDGASVWFLGCCAKLDNGPLMFCVFALRNGALVNVPISGAGSGRGWLDVASDGWMYWSSWEGSSIRPAGPPARVPGAVQVQHGGVYVIAPNGSVRVFVDQNGFEGRQVVSLVAYGIPMCQALNVRLALDADAGRIFRCGPEVADQNLQAAAMLTVSGLGIEVRAYESGVISTTPARTLLIATENGAIMRGFVDVTGWWA